MPIRATTISWKPRSIMMRSACGTRRLTVAEQNSAMSAAPIRQRYGARYGTRSRSGFSERLLLRAAATRCTSLANSAPDWAMRFPGAPLRPTLYSVRLVRREPLPYKPPLPFKPESPDEEERSSQLSHGDRGPERRNQLPDAHDLGGAGPEAHARHRSEHPSRVDGRTAAPHRPRRPSLALQQALQGLREGLAPTRRWRRFAAGARTVPAQAAWGSRGCRGSLLRVGRYAGKEVRCG